MMVNTVRLGFCPWLLFRERKAMGLFDRMKLSTGDGVVETIEAVSGDKPQILEETVGYTVTPGDTVLVTPLKRKSDVALSDLGGPSRRKKIVVRKPPLCGPGLKPKTSGTPPPAAAGRVFISTDSDSASSASSGSSSWCVEVPRPWLLS